MRILAVQIRNHPGLGDLDLDFRGEDGRAARLIVIAGENGSGKTAVLEAIFAALAPSSLLSASSRIAPGKYRILIQTDGPNTSVDFNAPIDPETFGEIRERWPNFDGLVVDVDGDAVRARKPHHKYARLSDNTRTQGIIDSVSLLGTGFGCFYSEANVSFDVPRVDKIGTSAGAPPTNNVAAAALFPVRGGSALAGEMAQLLVDLQAADDAETARWVEDNEGQPPPAEVRRRRIRKFTEAFARVVAHKRYRGVETIEGEHRVTFEERGFRTALGDLSTGEKQIIFRGAFLLRHAEKLAGAVTLIDEPELSLHPRWQENVLSFYDTIVEETPDKSSQVIVATHSPFVVHGSPTAKHIILRRDPSTGLIAVDPTPSYPSVSSADVAVAAFDVSTFVREARGRRLALLVEGPTDQKILEEAWRKLRPSQPMPFTIGSADGAKNTPRLLGTGGGKSGPLLDALSQVGTVLVGLFDFDQEGVAQWNGTVVPAENEPHTLTEISCQPRKRRNLPIWAALLPVPQFRTSYASNQLAGDSRLTIELLFEDVHIAPFLTRVPVAGDGGATRLAAQTNAQKVAVADAVANFPAAAFQAFAPIFNMLDQIAAAS